MHKQLHSENTDDLSSGGKNNLLCRGVEYHLIILYTFFKTTTFYPDYILDFYY